MKEKSWVEDKKLEFKRLRENLGDFPQFLRETIEKDVRGYEVYLESFSRIDGNEFMDMLGIRDNVEIKIKELEKIENVDNLKKIVKELDEKFSALKPKILEQFGGLAEWPEYPKSFWWRHLKK